MKIAIFLLGPGASGKTTTRRALSKGEPEVLVERVPVRTRAGSKMSKYFATIYDNIAVAGNIISGADSNTSPDSIRLSFFKCLEHRDIVVVDGVMSAPGWMAMCNEVEDLKVICVSYELPPETVFSRLYQRRKGNGFVEAELPVLTKSNSIAFQRRAKNALINFQTKCFKPLTIVRVTENHSPGEIVALIEAAIAEQ